MKKKIQVHQSLLLLTIKCKKKTIFRGISAMVNSWEIWQNQSLCFSHLEKMYTKKYDSDEMF